MRVSLFLMSLAPLLAPAGCRREFNQGPKVSAAEVEGDGSTKLVWVHTAQNVVRVYEADGTLSWVDKSKVRACLYSAEIPSQTGLTPYQVAKAFAKSSTLVGGGAVKYRDLDGLLDGTRDDLERKKQRAIESGVNAEDRRTAEALSGDARAKFETMATTWKSHVTSSLFPTEFGKVYGRQLEGKRICRGIWFGIGTNEDCMKRFNAILPTFKEQAGAYIAFLKQAQDSGRFRRTLPVESNPESLLRQPQWSDFLTEAAEGQYDAIVERFQSLSRQVDAEVQKAMADAEAVPVTVGRVKGETTDGVRVERSTELLPGGMLTAVAANPEIIDSLLQAGRSVGAPADASSCPSPSDFESLGGRLSHKVVEVRTNPPPPPPPPQPEP